MAPARLYAVRSGTVRFGPHDVFGEGRMAGFTDPEGARFALITGATA
ncbi:hypothetical protein [Streptosporangium saharense]